VSPVASRIAAEHGIDLHQIKGTGPDGRILRRDVEAAIGSGASAEAPAATPAAPAATAAVRPTPTATTPSPAPTADATPTAAAAQSPAEATGLPTALPASDTIFEPSKLRQTMARRMAQSKGPAPHYYLTTDVDMTEAQALRKQLNESAKGEYRVSVNDLVIRSTILAIAEHPLFNATFTQDGAIQLNAKINMGVAVAVPEGLIAPCLVDVRSKSLIQLSQEAKDLAERTRANRLRPEEYAAGTFTISNLGMYGIDIIEAIINPPQSAILGVGRVAERAVVRDHEIVIRETMTIALSADHRVTTGAEGAEFLATIRETLESPVRLLV
jgi:pyruvate dehydrogenase E2 component (dihydrolipoamide acetyltransferase)